MQIAGAALVVVRAGAPRAEVERAAAQATGSGKAGDGTMDASAAAELRGRLEPLVWCRGYGLGRVEDSTVVNVNDTPFDCGSCARILTALASMQLWQVRRTRTRIWLTRVGWEKTAHRGRFATPARSL